MLKRIKHFFLPALVSLIYSFLYVPIFIVIIFSFNKASIGYKWIGFTTEWYKELLYSNEIWHVFKNSIIVATSTVILSLILGIALAWGLYRKNVRFFSLFYSTIMIPEIVLSVGLLSLFILFSVPLGLNALIIGHTLLGLGFVVPILHVRFQELNYSLVEASLDLGANIWYTFFKVVFPFLIPAIVSAALLVFIISLDDFLISFFCSDSTSQTLSLYIYSTIRAGVSPLVNALSTVMLAVSSLLVLLFIYISVKLMPND
jgi:spermidine/putrescine transport system permease protein